MALSGTPVSSREGTIPCPEAGDSLKYAIIGIFCFGVILGPLAISKGLAAKKAIAADPELSGNGKATAGIIIGSLALIFWIIGIITRFSEASQY